MPLARTAAAPGAAPTLRNPTGSSAERRSWRIQSAVVRRWEVTLFPRAKWGATGHLGVGGAAVGTARRRRYSRL